MKKTFTLLAIVLLCSLVYNIHAQTPNCTVNISPANSATDVASYPFITLKWTPVAGATSYDVYYSPKVPPKQVSANVSADSFRLPNAAFNTVYYWYIVPKNADGAAIGCVSTVTSFTTGAPPPPPANDNCNGAVAITLLPVNGTTLGATQSQPALHCSGYTGSADDDVWYTYTPTVSGTQIISLTNSENFDGVLEIFSGNCGSLTSLTCSDTSQYGEREQVSVNVTAGTAYKIRVYSFDAGLSAMGTFTLSVVNQVLPVTFLNFSGERRDGKTLLNWATATETNNKGFEIQYSTDGNNFESLAFAASKAINGNSSSRLSYQYIDANALAGNTYYRLKQLDKNGQASFSEIISIKGEKINALSIGYMYPNPARNTLNLTIASPSANKIKFKIMDLSGKLVIQQETVVSSGINKLPVNVSRLASGSYFIKGVDNGGIQTPVSKFVKE